jgi:hypothetical protein
MAIIDITELKSVLGIGSIYPDAEVQQVADAASDIILSYLDFNRASIVSVELEDNVATFYTVEPHDFVVGSALTVTGCGATFNGSRTVTEHRADSFKVAITAADVVETPQRPYGSAVLTSQAALYDLNDSVREACLALAVDIWETRKGTMGQQGVDFAPAPYRLGRSMLQRIMGLLGKNVDTNSLVG